MWGGGACRVCEWEQLWACGASCTVVEVWPAAASGCAPPPAAPRTFVADQHAAQPPRQRELDLILLAALLLAPDLVLVAASLGVTRHFLQDHEDGGEHRVQRARQQQHAVRGAWGGAVALKDTEDVGAARRQAVHDAALLRPPLRGPACRRRSKPTWVELP